MKNSEEIVKEANEKYPIGKEITFIFDNKAIQTKIRTKARYLFCGTLAIGIEHKNMIIAVNNI